MVVGKERLFERFLGQLKGINPTQQKRDSGKA